MTTPSYEKLGAFYLGRLVDPDTGEVGQQDLLYDAKDLTTHAVCVGMTGSGKTGLCLGLLEEAAIDGIPVLAIDPKGDLGNLLLSFPDLRAEDFAPWIDPGEALRKGVEPNAYAAQVAASWRDGLAKWGQDGARIQRFRDACELTIYTPGSSAGMPLTVLRSFAAPPPALRADPEALGERVTSAVSGLLGLLGLHVDPVQSREHILLSNIVSHAWRDGRDLSLGNLIREVQAPPFDKVGFFDLESFFPGRERMAFAMTINNLLASPTFAAWMQGEPLDIGKLMRTESGKPRVSILSIAHLDEAQRMFFVTLLLNELVAWMRTQAGTTSLRGLLYMDEVFGYFPPVANPPSKLPMLTLLKQARAFGIGCVLATQNPVDLDYKGLSNTGTWFLGRLQTERDKARVLDGLEGASAAAGVAFDRRRMEAILSGLRSRVFLMNNVHDDAPVLFHSRWAMSYLRGPLTRAHIETLMRGRKEAGAAAASPTSAPPQVEVGSAAERPVVESGVVELFAEVRSSVHAAGRVSYHPALFAEAKVHFVNARQRVDAWRDAVLVAELHDESIADPWAEAVERERAPEVDAAPEQGAGFAALPSQAVKSKSYAAWVKELGEHLYRTRTLAIRSCKQLGLVSGTDETERDFRGRLVDAAREARDLEIEKLRKRYAPRLAGLQERIRTAEGRVEREKAELKQGTLSTALSIGTTLLGALFGRKVASAGNIRSAASTMRQAGRTAQQKGDVGRAEAQVDALQQQLAEMEAEFAEESERIKAECDVDQLEVDETEVSPRKSDIEVTRIALLWLPWLTTADGRREALFD
ncbi:MAG: ATP-binding protein [Planctomycetes bacterium]|nr:ATP-binding protein [Planctomycetota bacterium]MCB9869914.1 ATP-binding protein [Planctomycetota bacterium]